jgi:hypothetical protein
MKKLRIGIVGCGGIANQKHMPSLKANGELNEIVAFCDIVEERAVKAAREYGSTDAKVYSNYNDLVNDPDVGKANGTYHGRCSKNAGCVEEVGEKVHRWLSEPSEGRYSDPTCLLCSQ